MEQQNRDDPISLKQCERIHDDLNKLICSKVDRVESTLATRLDGMDRALELSSRQLSEFKQELKLHLDMLNHYKAQEVADRKELLPKDAFAEKIKDIDRWISNADNNFTKLSLANDARLTRSNIISIVSLLLVALMFVIRLATYFKTGS